MDNLSHSLVGVAIAELAVARKSRLDGFVPASLRRWAFFLAVVGSNAGDLDILVRSLTAGKLGYLLHHRGHTHTLVAAPVIAAALVGLALVARRFRAHLWTARDGRWLLAVTSVATLMHLAFDYLNSYGVHVLWPLDNRWSYGDTLFIVEPTFWLALAVPLGFAARTLGGRAALRVVQVLALGLIWFSGFVPMPLAAGATLATVALYAVARRVVPERQGLLATAALGLVIGLFYASSGLVRARLVEAYARAFPQGRLADVILTPMPANPMCWLAIHVASEGESMVLRQAQVALWGELLPVTRCPDPGPPGIAPLTTVRAGDSVDLRWRGEYTMAKADLRAAASRCDVAAFLRFARAPFAHAGLGVFGDLRFDRDGGGGFAEIHISDAAAPCPERVPPWVPPRSDMLRDEVAP